MILFVITCFAAFGSVVSDKLTIYHLQAALFKSKFGTTMANFKLYHFGIGFKDSGGSYFHADYTAIPSVATSLYPNTTSGDAVWQNYAVGRWTNGLNRTYWDDVQPIMEIDSSKIDAFKAFVRNYNSTFDAYKLMDVGSSSDGKIVLEGSNCAHFLRRGLSKLRELGATDLSNFTGTVKYDNIALVVNATPVEISYNQNKNEIISYYNLYKMKFDNLTANLTSFTGVENFFFQILSELPKAMIYHWSDQKYYRLSIVEPYIKFKYDDFKLPVYPGHSDDDDSSTGSYVLSVVIVVLMFLLNVPF